MSRYGRCNRVTTQITPGYVEPGVTISTKDLLPGETSTSGSTAEQAGDHTSPRTTQKGEHMATRIETARMTMAQAVVKFLAQQYVERDGVEQPFFAGVWGIFGHGNVAGIG